MRIGLIINEYRSKNKISMDKFSEKSGLSKSYICILEQGLDRRSGNPVQPSIATIKKIAKAMDMDFKTLFNKMNNEEIL